MVLGLLWCGNVYAADFDPTTLVNNCGKVCEGDYYCNTCICEGNLIEKTKCKLKKRSDNKTTRSDAAENCAQKAENISKEIRKEYYKDCMKDLGF